MRNNRITGPPLNPLFPPTDQATARPAALPEPAEFAASGLSLIWRRKSLALKISMVLTWSWAAITVIVATVLLRKSLPSLSLAYIFAGVTIAITVAGVGAPLLNLMSPRKAFASVLSLSGVKTGVFRAQFYPEEYVDHPDVNRVFQAAANGPA